MSNLNLDRSRAITAVSTVGGGINLALAGMKTFAGLTSGSAVMLLDALNSLSTLLSSLIDYAAAKLSGKTGKAEPQKIKRTISIVIAAIIMAAGLTAIACSVVKIIHPGAVSYTLASIVIIAGSLAVNTAFGIASAFLGRKLDSAELRDMGKDSGKNSFVSLCTLGSAVTGMTAGINIEGYVGLLISVSIIASSAKILADVVKKSQQGRMALSVKD